MIEIKTGDVLELLKKTKSDSVDLIVTSPPYTNQRIYGTNIKNRKNDEYVDWLIDIFRESHRVLKISGSFILNINDKCEDQYRSTVIYDLISRNKRETNLKLYDSYYWLKKTIQPNCQKKRFNNKTEFIFHFCKDVHQMKFYMKRVLQPSIQKGCNKLVIPCNVFQFDTAGTLRDNLIHHPAPFNKQLPLYFINLLTDENDLVMDLFSGSGTTGLAAKESNRNYIGFEICSEYAEYSKKRIENKHKYTINYKNEIKQIA